MSQTDENALDGPEFEMWNHLYSGIDQARTELNELPENTRARLTELGVEIMSLRTNLVAQRDNQLADLSPMLLQDPWIKFSADMAFAEDAVTRASAGFDRYVDLRPILTAYELSDVAAKCLEEAGQLFLFSFDSGCVVFCGAALEQTLRKAIEDAGHTPRERDTIGPLIKKAYECNLLSEGAKQAACELKSTRNDVLHRPFMVVAQDLRSKAIEAMDNLGKVLEALGQSHDHQGPAGLLS